MEHQIKRNVTPKVIKSAAPAQKIVRERLFIGLLTADFGQTAGLAQRVRYSEAAARTGLVGKAAFELEELFLQGQIRVRILPIAEQRRQRGCRFLLVPKG